VPWAWSCGERINGNSATKMERMQVFKINSSA
jgi:hypothetical protein